MYLQKLTCNNFKNHREIHLEFSAGINCLTGNNGTGKTNILDAIYYLSFCKSYFNNIDHQNILHGEPFFSIHGNYNIEEDKNALVQCIQEREKNKQFRYNKKAYKRMADHIGKIPLVMISPYDRDLINEGSDVRRKFIDGLISQFDNIYLDNLLRYNKALQQRNALLKLFSINGFFDNDMLEQWTNQLIRYGEPIYKKRIEMIEIFTPVFQKLYNEVSNGNENVNISYNSLLNEMDYKSVMNNSLEKDRTVRHTTCGIHRDDLNLLINDYPLKKFGSQGQQKSYVTALKLAQFEHYRKIKDIKPILLLDDIFDKLDRVRVAQLVSLVGENGFGQVFITDTQAERIEELFTGSSIEHKTFVIENDGVREV